MNGTLQQLFILAPRWPGGEGRVRGAEEPFGGAAHLTFPSWRVAPLPLPPEGRRGAFLLDLERASRGRSAEQ